jgi:hypothetical protein
MTVREQGVEQMEPKSQKEARELLEIHGSGAEKGALRRLVPLRSALSAAHARSYSASSVFPVCMSLTSAFLEKRGFVL